MKATMAWRCRACDDLVKDYLCVPLDAFSEDEDMDIDDEEDENEPELTFPYEEVEDTVEPEDETVLASVYEVGESFTATFLQEDNDDMLPSLMRRDINSL
ncbi:hypothetical protein Tco_0132418, partial [Tanacetum coccineum]